jgi:hypothetical protein
MKNIVLTARHLSIIFALLLVITIAEYWVLSQRRSLESENVVMPARCTDLGCIPANDRIMIYKDPPFAGVPLADRSTRYMSNQFGFSLLIPTKLNPSTCDGASAGTGKVIVLEEGNSLYFTPDTFYDWTMNDLNDYSKGYTCHLKTGSLATVKGLMEGYSNFPLWYHFGWQMVVDQNIQNEEDLLSFIRRYYGSTCEIDQITPAEQLQTMDVIIRGDTGDDTAYESSCPLNFIYALKYSPEKRTAVTWKVGQDGRFDDLDYDMIDSFRFE